MPYNLWENIIVQERARVALEKIFSRNHYPAAIIFVGPKGVGKEAHAFAFAQSINCIKNKFDPCGECERCKNIYNFLSPDIYLVFATPTSQADKNKINKKIESFLEKKNLIPT